MCQFHCFNVYWTRGFLRSWHPLISPTVLCPPAPAPQKATAPAKATNRRAPHALKSISSTETNRLGLKWTQGACHPLIGKTCERDFCQRKSTTTIQCVRSYRELAEQIRHRQMKGFPRRLIPCHQQIQRQFYTKTMWMTIRRGQLVN